MYTKFYLEMFTRLYATGTSWAKVSKEMNIPISTLQRWRAELQLQRRKADAPRGKLVRK
ncbi:MAG: hypothetical protein ACHP8B_10785 [Terriglobales bacterium]